MAGGLRTEPTLDATKLPRMADFALFAESVCQGLGHSPGAFLAAYQRNRRTATESLLDDSPVARAFREFADRFPFWTGTASELLDELTELAGPRALTTKSWPKTPKGLSAIIRRLAPQLRATGVAITFSRDQHQRVVTVATVNPAGVGMRNEE